MKLPLNYFAILIFIGVITYSICTPSTAYSQSVLGLKPANSKTVNLEDAVNPGDTKNIKYKLVNLSNDVLNIKLFSADLKTTSKSGEYIYDENTKELIGKFVSPEVNNVVLNRNEKKLVNLVIHIPNEVKPGEYIGGLIAKDQDSGVILGTSKINLVVKGDLKRDIDVDFSKNIIDDHIKTKFKVTNNGNTVIEGLKIDLSLKNNKLKKFINVERKEVITSKIVIPPGETKIVSDDLDFNLDPIGDYELSASIEYGGLQPFILNDTFSYTSNKKVIYIISVALILLFPLLFLFYFFIKWFLKRRKKVKEVNKRWENLVQDLLKGNIPNSNSTIKDMAFSMNERDMNVVLKALRKEVRTALREELKNVVSNPNNFQQFFPSNEYAEVSTKANKNYSNLEKEQKKPQVTSIS